MAQIFDSSPNEALFERTRGLAIWTASSGKGGTRQELGTVLRSSAAIAALAGVALLSGDGNNAVQAADDTSVLKQVASVDLPGPPGKRFDYLVIDYDDGWLFSAHLAANQTYVIGLKSNDVLHTIVDTPGVEGLEYVPDERKVYTSNAGDNTVGVIDPKTMKVVRKIPTERKPDGSTYAAVVRKL